MGMVHPGLLKEAEADLSFTRRSSVEHAKDPWYGAAPNQTRRAGLQLRASGGGGEPPEPSVDGNGSDGRRNSKLPEDMLRSFRNRMRQMNAAAEEVP
eukprot:6227185-Amphidinium_carterae.1